MNVAITNVADLGIAVRSARKALGLSQNVLASIVGVGPRFVVELEAGKPTVQLDKVLAVITALGITLHVQLPEQ